MKTVADIVLEELFKHKNKVAGDISRLTNIELDGIDTADYPDFVDAFICYAEDINGVPLTDEELNYINDEHSDFVQELAYTQACEG